MSKRYIKPYYDEKSGKSYTEKQISRQNRLIKIRVMKTWFFHHYENPANICPYDSNEDGYIQLEEFSDTDEILFNEFFGLISDKIINELVEELNNESTEWCSTAFMYVEADRYIDIIEKIDVLKDFHAAITDVEKLLNAKITKSAEQKFYFLLYSNVITILETYLSDKFIKIALNEDIISQSVVEKIYKNLIENINPRKNKIPSEKENVIKLVNNFVWHKIGNIKALFESLFGREFVSKYFSFTLEEIQKRHNIVHRNGKDEKGNVIFIKKEEVIDLISKINEFVRNIDKVLNKEVTDNFFTYYDSR